MISVIFLSIILGWLVWQKKNSPWLELKGTLSKKNSNMVAVVGMLFLSTVWVLVAEYGNFPRTILPHPWKVVQSVPVMIEKNNLFGELWYSVKLNLMGYAQAISVSVVFGMLIGIFAPLKSFFGPSLYSFRYIPITALTPIMIAWFGIHDNMKVQFLSLGITVFLLPAVIERTRETLDIYMQTAKTLGATKRQIITSVFIPDVIGRIMPDIRIMTAMSWTYIIMAEMINKTGGIGALMWSQTRRGNYESAYALLVVLILVGITWDWILKLVDRLVARHKYSTTSRRKGDSRLATMFAWIHFSNSISSK